jgi:AAHS family 4-hydroxybenzoate transporter-like MFS transporter
VLWLTNFSHAVNHELGVLTAVMSILGGASQGLYGFATPFLPRAWLLGIGNIVLGLGTLATGWVGSFSGFLGTRAVASAGTSAQHPVGSSLLVGYFPRKPGTVLALNTSISNIGSLLAPMAAAAMLLIMDWRHIFMIVASLSIAMGAAYFLFRKRVEASSELGRSRPEHDYCLPGSELGRSRRAKLARGKDSYLRVFRNRNMIIVSLVMMVGGAGRDMGVNLAYLGPHFKNDLALTRTMVAAALTAMQAGGVVGPIILGWLSDRVSRKGVIQVSLLLSALTTLWLGFRVRSSLACCSTSCFTAWLHAPA